MTFVRWATRCIPGLSVLALLILIESALQIFQTSLIGLTYPTGLIKRANPFVAQFLFSTYTIFLHVQALLFPLRLCRAVWYATSAIKQAQHESGNFLSNKEKDNDGGSPRRRKDDEDSEIVHAIIIPIYKEQVETLEDTLNVLASHPAARYTYDVFLAMEERDPNAKSTASKLLLDYKSRFQGIQYTLHPADLEGEAPGKSSNVGWAAREVQQKYFGKPGWKDKLVTVIDSDTHLLSNYFDLVTQSHMQNRKQNDGADMTLYMPPIIFDRNAHMVPLLVRSADLMWCGAGLSCYQKKPTRRDIGIPTSVYTLPLPLVSLVQGWDTGPDAIGEDMHMMLKCYFVTRGHLLIESIPSPASQCNVSSEKKGLRGYVLNHKARYTQALRHMWGCLDTGYAITQWWKMGRDPPTGPIPSNMTRKRRLSATEHELKLLHHQFHEESASMRWRNLVLFSRIFEAHFIPFHVMVLMSASTAYSNFSNPIVRCRLLTFALNLTGILRALSFVAMLLYFVIFYEQYHVVCVEAREAEMRRVGLYENMENRFSYRRPRCSPLSYLDYVLFPVAGTIFGSVPLLQAALSHFRSEKLVYTVSAKPIRRIAMEALEREDKMEEV